MTNRETPSGLNTNNNYTAMTTIFSMLSLTLSLAQPARLPSRGPGILLHACSRRGIPGFPQELRKIVADVDARCRQLFSLGEDLSP